MTGKDVLTLLLCTFGYDRNIRINVERLGYEEPCYDVHAENAEGDVYEQIDSEGLMFHIYEIISYMTEYNCYINGPSEKTRYMDLQKLHFESNWWGVPPKYVLDQKQREKTVVAKDERERQIKEDIERMKPFNEWCRLNGVELTQDIWIGPYTSFGYGYFDEIPAAYVLKYLDFQTCMNFVKVNLWTWKNGTQYIWEQLNDHLKHPARLNSKIDKVERKDGKVFVTVNGAVEEYDKIIVTAPLYIPNKRTDGQIGMVDYFDAREDEKALFSKIDYERYDVLAVETKPEDHPEISYYVFENMQKERLGHLMVYYRRWKDTKDQVITTYALRKHKDTAEIPYETCRQMVLDDLKTMHNPASNVINEWSVYYFPHVFSKDYADGWYDKVEAMQGKYDTYYAGEVMSFGDMDETAEYSRELVARFF